MYELDIVKCIETHFSVHVYMRFIPRLIFIILCFACLVLFHSQDADPEFVEITPLTHVPMSSVEQFVGRLQLHLIKESWSFRDEGGLGAFAHVFLAGMLVSELDNSLLFAINVSIHYRHNNATVSAIYLLLRETYSPSLFCTAGFWYLSI